MKHRFLALLLLVPAVLAAQMPALASSCDEEREPIIGKDFKHSDNLLISTVEATAIASTDASLHASTDASTEATTAITSGDLPNDGKCSRTSQFVRENKAQIARDVAAGSGEHLQAVAALLAISEADRSRFAALAQAHFTEIFPTAAPSSGEIVTAFKRIREEQLQDPSHSARSAH